MYDWRKPVDSLWESERGQFEATPSPPLCRDVSVDVAIIGAGYCGLSAAYHLARRGVDVGVLEAGDIGWGASGRNAGFCSIGASFLGPEALKNIFGRSETQVFYRELIDAVHLVDQLATEENIDLKKQGRGVWTFAHKANRLRELRIQAELLNRLGATARLVTRENFAGDAFQCTEQYGALHESVGFGLHPLAYCLGLASAAIRRGAQLHSQSRVIGWYREGSKHRLTTNSGTLRARHVIVATNGWLPEALVPELAGRLIPIMSNITTTAPLSPSLLEAQGWQTQSPASNTRAHLSYLRMLPGNRLLFGGRGDTTGTPRGLAAMRRLLEARRARLLPALENAETSHSWRGFISATRRLTPAVGVLTADPSISYAFGCHGNGVAFMTWAGRALARFVLGQKQVLPAVVTGLPDRFPAPALRLWALRAMLARTWLEDTMT